MPLNPNHLADLRSSGLNDNIIQQAQIHSCSAKYANTYLQRNDITGDLLAFPYAPIRPEANSNLFVRFKSDKDLHYKDGSSGRYVQKGGSESHLYSLPQIWARVNGSECSLSHTATYTRTTCRPSSTSRESRSGPGITAISRSWIT